MNKRESMQFDVVIVGAGPSGLTAAIRLKQLNSELSICILEKGAEVGAHLLSGAVFDPIALNELIADWQALGAPLKTAVTTDHFLFLQKNKAWNLPVPPQMQNHGNYIISLGELGRWLAQYAESLGVEIYPGFPASEILFNDKNEVIGVATGDMGLDKHSNPKPQFQKGMELYAKQTIFAEGCRGSLTKQLFAKYDLQKTTDPQTYGLGLKELWQVKSDHYTPGKVVHSLGWPLDTNTYGGGFIYHLDNNQVYIGFVVGLDYQNPYLSPYDEFQKFKTHPAIKPLLEGGQRLAYGARALSEGGLQSLPKLSFPGGLIVGDAAGFLNVPRIKGNHTAMKSGMVAAESILPYLNYKEVMEVETYQENLQKTWLWEELYKARNIRPAFHWGLWPGLIYSALDTYIFKGKAPWTLHHHQEDYQATRPAKAFSKPEKFVADGKITFNKLDSVFYTNTNHEEDQPCHLKLKDPSKAITINYQTYASPERYYCPAGVYEILDEDHAPRLQINAQNCIHCKTCDIKDPEQNINWECPEGGGGPGYPNM